MAGKVRDGSVSRAGAAGVFAPAAPGYLRQLKSEAAELTARAIGGQSPPLARRALGARAEARLAERVANHRPADLDPGGPMPYGPARGGLVHDVIHDIGQDAKTGEHMVTDCPVRRRRGPSALASVPAKLRDAALRYAHIAEMVQSPGGPNPDAPRGGGVSDGGAVSRVEMARMLGVAEKAIGVAMALTPRGRTAHADRARRAIGVRHLVDSVCLHGRSINQVLVRNGWSRRASHKKALRAALEAALERLAETI